MAEIKIAADSGGGSVGLKGPASTTSNAAVQLTLPVDDGTVNQVLTTNGSGTLSWAAPVIADDSITEAKLDIHAAPSGTDKYLAYTSNGMEWATAGITEFDMWRVTSDFAQAADVDISANWERVDTEFEKIGTGLTESSGVFTFPSTGKWLINAFAYTWTNSAPNYVGIAIYLSDDSGASFNKRTENLTSVSSGELAGDITSVACFDITNTSVQPWKIRTIADGSINYGGHSTQNRTGFWAMKLGGT